jgi:IclR family pca regulon transcriptional regulator
VSRKNNVANVSKFPHKKPRAHIGAAPPRFGGALSRAGASRVPPPATGSAPHGRYFVESLGRGLGLLDSFVDGPTHLTLGELSERIGLNKATTFRLLRTLQEAGYLRHDPMSKHYSLSLKALDLQEASLGALDYLSLAQPFLEELNTEVGEAVNIAVLEETSVRYVARIAGQSLLSVNLHVGSKLPAHATSMGKVLLAALPETKVRELYADSVLQRFTPSTIRSIDGLCGELAKVRRNGYAIADEELEPGLRSAAVPILDSRARVVAALNIATSTARVASSKIISDLVPRLLKTAAGISTRLGYRSPGLGRHAPSK